MLGKMNMGEMDIPANNRAIVSSAWKAARGELDVETRAGYCLRTVRQIVQDALGINHQEFYDRYRITVTTASENRGLNSTPWAADVERTMKIRNYHLPLVYLRQGDIVFNHDAAAPIGHVGIMLDDNTVLENIDIGYRANSVKLPSGLVITPRRYFKMTLAARLP
jgi:hypothetical protein